MHFINWLLPIINQFDEWVYVFIFLVAFLESLAFVGLFIPGTTIIVFFGFLVFTGALSLPLVLLVVAFGSVVGDVVSFYLGRAGTTFFSPQGKILTSKHLLLGEKFFNNHGAKSVVAARFVGPLRPIVPFVAGLFAMPAKKFIILSNLGGIATTIFHVGTGFVFGHAWVRILRLIGRIGIGALVLIVIVLLAGYIIKQKTSLKI